MEQPGGGATDAIDAVAQLWFQWIFLYSECINNVSRKFLLAYARCLAWLQFAKIEPSKQGAVNGRFDRGRSARVTTVVITN